MYIKESSIEGCGFPECRKVCLSCKLHHPEICCVAEDYPEKAEEYCLIPKFVCGYINRGGKHNDNNILSTGN